MPRAWLRNLFPQIVVWLLFIAASSLSFLGVFEERQLLIFLEHSIGAQVTLVAPFSFLENIAGFNIYFPGSVVILVAMGLTHGDPWKGLGTFFLIVVPSTLAHILNYCVGRFVKRRENGSARGSSLGFALAGWHPHLMGLVSVGAGADGWDFGTFLRRFLPWHFAWNTFWGVVMYTAGGSVIREAGLSWFFVLYLVIWTGWGIRKECAGSVSPRA